MEIPYLIWQVTWPTENYIYYHDDKELRIFKNGQYNGNRPIFFATHSQVYFMLGKNILHRIAFCMLQKKRVGLHFDFQYQSYLRVYQ